MKNASRRSKVSVPRGAASAARPKGPLALALARKLRAAQSDLTARWLERISDRVALDANRLFPTDDLLDHVPRLIGGIADYLERPTDAVAGDAEVIAKAMELGALRHAQGFDDHEILKEFEIFGRILFGFFADTIGSNAVSGSRGEICAVYERLFESVSIIQQATATQFHELTRRRVTEREARLRLFNRGLTHELRNHIDAALGATEMLEMRQLELAEYPKLTGVVLRNLRAMEASLTNLLELTRLGTETIPHRHVRLPEAAREAMRQMRDAARSANVAVRLASDIVDVEVNAAAVELCLANLLSNAIKYADKAKPERWVEIAGRVVPVGPSGPAEIVVEVRDNGVGVAESARSYLFDRFFRASAERAPDVPGTGLGLSIVRDAVEGLGGRVWAEFSPDGSTFAFALPSSSPRPHSPSSASG